MKKILTLAIMALFVCGLTINANAQDNRTATPDNSKKTEKTVKPKEPKASATVKTEKKGKAALQNAGKTNNIDKTLKEFEAAVDKCVNLFNNPKVDPKEYQQSLTKAESLKSEVEKAKPQMDRTQVDRFNKAVQKLSVVYKKG